MKRRALRHIPELNTTSTADISFMLLIFFLVTTSMDADKGMMRQLPPADDSTRQVTLDIQREHVLAVTLDAEGHFVADGDTLNPSQLQQRASDFIYSQGRDHLITLKTAPDATYNDYFEMQNHLALAYADARDRMARQRLGKPLNKCSADEQQELFGELPHRVAEDY